VLKLFEWLINKILNVAAFIFPYDKTLNNNNLYNFHKIHTEISYKLDHVLYDKVDQIVAFLKTKFAISFSKINKKKIALFRNDPFYQKVVS